MSKLEIQTHGKDPGLWAKFSGKFKSAIQSLLDIQTNAEENKTIRDELKEYASLAIESGKSLIEKPTLENHMIRMQIQKGYEELEKTRVEREILSVEARKQNLKQTLSELKLMMIFAKQGVFNELAESSGDYDMILFIQNADAILEGIRQWEKEAGE